MLPLRKRAAEGVASRLCPQWDKKQNVIVRNGPTRGHFPFQSVVQAQTGPYASRIQSNATRGVPSDTYTIPVRSKPALRLAPCIARLS